MHMKNFLQIPGEVDTVPLLMSLQLQPELWNQHRYRKDTPGTSHDQMSDIWIRFRAQEECVQTNADIGEHFPVFYPAYYSLPQLRPIIFSLMARMEATHLGGILITKIPPGGKIAPHADKGWHPEFYNCKLYVPLQSNAQCVNRVENEAVTMEAGSVWWFDNTKVHSVENNGAEDRITLIVCMRREG
jgi:hypothetical protein